MRANKILIKLTQEEEGGVNNFSSKYTPLLIRMSSSLYQIGQLLVEKRVVANEVLKDRFIKQSFFMTLNS